MKGLLIKTLVSVFVLSLLTITTMYFLFFSLDKAKMDEYKRFLNAGVFADIQARLINQPQSQWRKILKKIQPSSDMLTPFVKISALNLSKEKLKKLMQGEIVWKQHDEARFLYYSNEDVHDYQRIGRSDYALRIRFDLPTSMLISQPTAWMARLINLRLKEAPQSLWGDALANLSKQYGIPLSLEAIAKANLPEKVRMQLQTAHMAYLPSIKDKFIRTWYYQAPAPNFIIKAGPIAYPWWLTHRTLVAFSYIIIFSVLIVIILTWLFSRNVRKIYQMTRKYSQGEFDYKNTFSRLSTLYGTYKNINCMGDRLKQLIESQHNMKRFIAHETRTPLATMQLALERINESNNLTDTERLHLNSIQEDINDLNTLMVQFLLYSQNATQDLELKNQTIDLIAWMRETIKHFQVSKIEIKFNASSLESLKIECDSRLMRHAANNLINNALKFANKIIIITIEKSNHCVFIRIDDDGPGINEDEHDKIFHAFETLNTDTALGTHIGLGLMIAQTLVKKHQGTITVTQSPLLVGSRFTIQLPALST